MRAKRFLPYLLLAFSVALAPCPRAAAADNAASFMSKLGDRVLAIVNNRNTPEAQRKQQFRSLAESAFEVPQIARFVLGRYWRTASPADRQRFTQAFENYMIETYWSRFNTYNGESFRVSSEKDLGNGTTVVVTQIVRANAGQPPVNIDWYLVKRDNDFKIQDASVGGVSQALTYRDEFSSIIERNGGQLSSLVNELNKRAKR